MFFFQAEDGIRDLVRSRGLGDVYKRQGRRHVGPIADPALRGAIRNLDAAGTHAVALGLQPVSYTHLTLPTSDLV